MLHKGVLAFGCGCKGKVQVAGAPRTTSYQVVGPDQSVVAEFSTLPEARTKAIAVNGRVKVTTQVG